MQTDEQASQLRSKKKFVVFEEEKKIGFEKKQNWKEQKVSELLSSSITILAEILYLPHQTTATVKSIVI